MQHVENDMDDLFQRAADNYPFNAGKGDWEKVLQGIKDKDQPGNIVVALPGKKQYRKIILTALFLFTSTGGCIHTALYEKINRNAQQEATLQQQHPKNDNKRNSGLTDPVLIATGNNAAATSKSISAVASLRELTGTGNNHTTDRSVKGIYHVTVNTSPIGAYDTLQEESNLLQRLPWSFTGSLVAANNTQPKSPELFLKTPVQTADLKKSMAVTATFKRGLYAGITAGPDFSKGTAMPFKAAGWNTGLLVGYQFNKSLATESGVSWQTKSYGSQGKNFNMNKVAASMPAGMIINDLQSKISIIEVPVKIKYDFSGSTKKRLFVTGGISSYIITKEYNQYNVTLNGRQEKITGMYKKNSYDLAATATFSAGYQHTVFKRNTFRIEPFIKVPLQGIGIGSLPVTTAGLQLAIISQIK